MFKGTITALITPFKENGNIDYSTLEKFIEFQIENKVEGILPCGTTGESPTLTHEEDIEVIKFVAKKAKGRVKVIAGTGSNSTDHAVRATKEASALGIDGVLVVVPYYNKPTQEGLYHHYSAVAKSTDLPVVVYNIPGRTGINMEVPTFVRLFSEHKNIKCIKDAAGNLAQTSATIVALNKAGIKDYTLLSGDDGLALPMMSVGGQGVISVLSNAFPLTVSNMVRSALAGDYKKATEIHKKYFALMTGIFIESNPAPIKELMKQMKIISCSQLRLPLVEVKDETAKTLAKLLQEIK